ncbi:alpha/beta hydrolase [Lapillicoccus sp.]|uniref:alpha/beta hydrolase n=1 Tax=Lapillicoccus sp. TaxID=1909287 RepID=UPI003983CD88
MLDLIAAPLVRELVYLRRGTRVEADATTYSLDVDGTVLRGWVVNPDRGRALVYFGGNGERLDVWQDVFAYRFPKHTTYLIAYRGYGASDGLPGQHALSDDSLALIDHVAARHPDAHVDVVGRSLGTAVAVHVATRRDLAHLVLVTPFDSLVATAGDLFPGLPVSALIQDHWDSAAISSDVRAPVLVLRAGRDLVVRPPRTDALVAALPDPVVVSFAEADHATISDADAYWTSISQFLDDKELSERTH